MADGDTINVKGGTRISIDKDAGTSTASLIPAVAGKRIVVREYLLVVGAASKVSLLEETSGTVLQGPFDGVDLASAYVLGLTQEDAPVETAVAGRALQISRSVSAKVTGYMIYTTTD